MQLKICNICNIEKELSEFNKHSGCKFGVRPYCKKCHSIQSSSYQKKNSKHRKEYMSSYYSKNKDEWNKKTDEQIENYNKNRRKKYANDDEYREKIKKQVKKYNLKNPYSKLKNRIKSYGITLDEYSKMLENQNYGCAICGSKDSGCSKKERLHIDHCHKTGKVRGLLCMNCNQGIGKFYDDISLLENSIKYLKDSL